MADERAHGSRGYLGSGADPDKHIRFLPLTAVCFGIQNNYQGVVSTAAYKLNCAAGYSVPPLPSCLPQTAIQPLILLRETGPAIAGSIYIGTWDMPESANDSRSRRLIAVADDQSCTVLFQNDVVTSKQFMPFVAGDFYNYPFRGFQRQSYDEMLEIKDGADTEYWLLVDVYGVERGTLIVPYAPGRPPDPDSIQLF